MVEMGVCIAALLLILVLGRVGMYFGGFHEVASAALLFLAMLFTLRYWYVATRWVTGWFNGAGAGYATFGGFWALFLVGCLPLIVVMNRVTERSIPKYPQWLDSLLGLVFGLVSATILVCAVMTSLSVIVPKFWPEYNHAALTVPLDSIPISVYRSIETGALGISTNHPGHTRLPTLEKEDVDDLQKYWR